MQGRGERVIPLDVREKLYMLLICPQDGVSTGKCFSEYDRVNGENTLREYGENTQYCVEALTKKDVFSIGRYLTNDLFIPAATLCTQVGEAYGAAQGFSPIGAVMTGAGSCVLALFENREFCEWAKSRYKGKARTIVVETVEPEKKKKGWRTPFSLSEEESALLDLDKE